MKKLISLIVVFLSLSVMLAAQTLTPDQKTKVNQQMEIWRVLGTDPAVVKAVKAYNAQQPADTVGMTQEKWDKLTVLDPIVRGLSKNELAEYLKTKRTPIVAELFVSGANGGKVALFAKTSSWNHSGKPKHDAPMTGKTWIGDPALDESTGKVLVQISFPVLDGGKPIGSIVVGLDTAKL
jgi:hypothetical protein